MRFRPKGPCVFTAGCKLRKSVSGLLHDTGARNNVKVDFGLPKVPSCESACKENYVEDAFQLVIARTNGVPVTV